MFSVQNKEMFEIPLNEVTNTSLTAKHEVMIELGGPDGEGGARDKNRKGDQLVEMRFYVPGQANQEGEGEEESNANVSYQDSKLYATFWEGYQQSMNRKVIMLISPILFYLHIPTTNNNNTTTIFNIQISTKLEKNNRCSITRSRTRQILATQHQATALCYSRILCA